MSAATIIVTKDPNGDVSIEVEAPVPEACADTARRLNAVARLLGGRLKGMKVPDSPSSPPPIPDTGRIKA